MSEEKDLPTLFQLTIALEGNSNQLESLHELFQRQQIEIDLIKETLQIQHEILDMIVTRDITRDKK